MVTRDKSISPPLSEGDQRRWSITPNAVAALGDAGGGSITTRVDHRIPCLASPRPIKPRARPVAMLRSLPCLTRSPTASKRGAVSGKHTASGRASSLTRRQASTQRCSAEIAGRPAFGVTLDDRTLDRIDDALTAEAQAAGSNMPVGLDSVSRLHSCEQSRAAGWAMNGAPHRTLR